MGRKWRSDTEIQTHGGGGWMSCVDGIRDGRDGAVNQGKPRIAKKPPEARKK